MCDVDLMDGTIHSPSLQSPTNQPNKQITRQRLCAASVPNGSNQEAGTSILYTAGRNGYHAYSPLTQRLSRLEFCIVELPHRVRVVLDADLREQCLRPSVVVALERRWTDEAVAEMVWENPFKGR